MNTSGSSVREMLEILVKAFVDEPEAVDVSEEKRPQATVLELRVAPADLGKVIGRQGKTARALRALLASAGEKLHRRFVLQIRD